MARSRRPRPEEDALQSLEESLLRLGTIAPTLGPAASSRTVERLEVLVGDLLRVRASLPKAERAIATAMTEMLSILSEVAPRLSKQAASRTRITLAEVARAVAEAVQSLDPVRTPQSVFDPARPDAAGRLVAIALLAQPRLPLAEVGRMYGSGVYALYYEGDHPSYRLLTGTQTPIYVGKADPKDPQARNPKEQDEQLTGRLRDHRRMIRKVQDWALAHPETGVHPLKITEFAYRRLVVATNAQFVAERYLIDFFKPIWNNDFGVCWGISKHGDDAKTRANKVSPFDVLHPGRSEYMGKGLEEAKTVGEINRDIERHLDENPCYKNEGDIIARFLAEFAQEAVELGATGVDDDDVEEEDEIQAVDAL